MSTKLAMLTIVAALALTIGVGSVQGDDFTDQNISGNSYNYWNLSNSLFVRTIAQGTQFVGTNLTDSTFTDADIAGANFASSTLTVPQLTQTGTWNQPNAAFYVAGFNPANAPAIQARSLNGVTLPQGMDLSGGIIPIPTAMLDFRGTDFNAADLTNVDLSLALYDAETSLIYARTTVYVSDNLVGLGVAGPSVLEVKGLLMITDGPAPELKDGRLELDGGTLALDAGDRIFTQDDRGTDTIRIASEKISTIEVSRNYMGSVVQMNNLLYGGGPYIVIPNPDPQLPPLGVIQNAVLSIEAPNANDWGVLSLNRDVTFEGLLNITNDARVQLMGNYKPVQQTPVPGRIVQAGLNVQNGAVLMGTGQIKMLGDWPGNPGASTVFINQDGTFAPGMVATNSPIGHDDPKYTIGGKMTIYDPVVFGTGSAFRVMIADDNDVNGVGVSSGMTVYNNVMFDDTSSLEVLVENQPNPFPPTRVGPGFITEQRSYLVIETLGSEPAEPTDEKTMIPGPHYSITGQPDWVNLGPAPALLELAIRMEDESGDALNDQMWLDVQPNGQKFAAFARNHNQRTIANALDTVDVAALPAGQQGDANALLGELQWVPANKLGHEMQLLAGVETVNNGMATLQTIRGVTDRTNDYLYQLRRASRKENVGGNAMVAADEVADADAAAALQAMSYDWHMRADAIGIWGNVDNDGSSGSYGYSYDSYGFMLAIERMVAPNLMVGMTLAGFRTDLDGQKGSGDADSDTLFVDLHGTYTMGDFYINAALGYAHSWIDSHRHTIGGRRPDGSTESNYYTAGIELGYNFDLEAVNVEPYVRLDYAYSRTDGWNEHNGGAANTNWDAWKHRSLRSSLGTRVEVPFSLASMPARVRADLAWEHEFNDSKADANGGFLGVPINVQSADLGNDALRAGVELEVDITENISLSGGYQFRGNHDWDQHMANLTLKCAW
jgi:outer membrane autotransporter protein